MEADHPIPQSAYGFRSIRPRTRAERRGLKDKVALEKDRINQRVGWQARMHQRNAPETSALLTSCKNGAAGYISNADRFHTDVVGEEYALRQQALQRRYQANEYRRNKAFQRDEDRWHQMEEKQQREEEALRRLREDGLKAKKNQSNVAYDILSLEYSHDADGQQQKYLDDMVRYRASQRTNMLIVKGDTRVPYNIISGDERPPVMPPVKPLNNNPAAPVPLSSRVDARVTQQPMYNYTSH